MKRLHAAGICDCCDAPWSEVEDDEQGEQLIEDLLAALGQYDTRFLRHARGQAELVNPDGWLCKMLAEYLQVWRCSDAAVGKPAESGSAAITSASEPERAASDVLRVRDSGITLDFARGEVRRSDVSEQGGPGDRASAEPARAGRQPCSETSDPASEPCAYCAGKGGRHRAVASRFLGTETQVHDGPWENCSFCGGTGVASNQESSHPDA